MGVHAVACVLECGGAPWHWECLPKAVPQHRSPKRCRACACVIGCWMLDVGCWMFSPIFGCWTLDVGCWMFCRMITFLEGALAVALPTHVVVNVHGVGYHVHIPLSSYDKLP